MSSAPPPLPFEDRKVPAFWQRVGLTLRLVFLKPLEAFAAIPRTRSLSAPWRLKMLLFLPAYVLLGLGLLLSELVLWVASLGQPQPLPREAQWFFPALGLALLVLGPLLQLLALYLGGLVLHALLWALRGTREGVGLRQTLRAAGYTQAVVGLLFCLPPLALLAYPAGRVALGLGLAKVHRTQPWRGLAASFIQAFLSFLTALALVLGLVFWLARQDQKARQITLPAPDLQPLPAEPDPAPGRI